MSVRTTETTVTFKRPFTLPSVDSPQPAGTYRLVMDEEEILGLSFLAFRRTATMLHIPAISRPSYPPVPIRSSPSIQRNSQLPWRRMGQLSLTFHHSKEVDHALSWENLRERRAEV